MNEQTANINRVGDQIAGHVTTFLNCHLNQEFHVEELRKYVFENVNGYIAPASPDRILRLLRQQGVVDYTVVNRRQSLYRALPVVAQGSLF